MEKLTPEQRDWLINVLLEEVPMHARHNNPEFYLYSFRDLKKILNQCTEESDANN